jgi:ATP-dependent DNA helicase PIF1
MSSLSSFAKDVFGVKIPDLQIKPIDISHIDLSREQEEMFTAMEEGDAHMFITGKAGTGKSVLLHYFQKYSSKKMVVCAPTGVAALNIGGQTIHSLFHLPIGFITKEKLRVDGKTVTLLKNIDCVVIDEISMVRADVMDGIDTILQKARGNNLPFGGAQIICFGDLYQLPPVIHDHDLLSYFRENHGGYYFFHAHVWKRTKLKVYELEQVFRQKDHDFREILNAIRKGERHQNLLDKLNTRVEMDIPEEQIIALVPTNAQVENLNSYKLNSIEGRTFTYRAEITGDLEQSFFPTDEYLQLKIGSQVMLLKNDTDKRWVNGSIGTVVDATDEEIQVRIDREIYSIPKVTWSKIKYVYNAEDKKIDEEIVASFTQFPLRLAWAITIHKSQGQTYERVVIDLGRGAFAHGQTYVALSRCRTLGGIYLRRQIEARDIIVDPVVIEFMQV